MREVEIGVRDLSGLRGYGVPLMQQALSEKGGPLTDPDADRGEQVAIMNLFAGAIGTLRNPCCWRS